MKATLEKTTTEIYFYVDGERKEAAPPGVTGDLSGVRGDLDACEITEEDRNRGIDIKDLIKK
jgi:hypothetical protein